MEKHFLKSEVLLELIFSAEHKDKEDEIINEVLHAYLRKLNCFMAGILKINAQHLIEKQLLPYTFKNDPTWQFLLEYIEKSRNKIENGFYEIIRDDHFYYIYCLPNYGYLVIGRKKSLDKIFKNEFRQVVKLLAKILSQSIEEEQRKQVEKKLADERRLLRTIIDNIPINIYTKDLNYRKTLANASELKHLGFSTEDEILGKTDSELYGELIGENTIIEDKKVLIDGDLILAEERDITNDKWALVSKLPIKEEDGTITGMVGISVDFTEQKKAQNQLLLYLNLLDNSSDAVQVTLPSGQLFYVNKTAAERLGINPKDANKYNVRDYISSFETLNDWGKHVDELKICDFMTLEGLNINQKTKATFPVEVQVKYVEVNGNGFIIANSRDITERKKAQEVLKESENRFRLMADSSPVLIWTSGTDKLCDYFNQTWLNFTGRALEQELGNGWIEGVHPDDFDHFLRVYMDSFDERKKFSIEYRLKHADGEYHWLLDIGTPRFTPEGTFIGYIGSCVDITEIKNVEKTLRYQTMALDQSPVSILMTNLKGEIEYANPKACKTSEYRLEELLGNNPRVLKSGETTSAVYEQLWNSITHNKTWKGIFHNKRKNGEFYWESAEIAPILDSNGIITSYLAIKEDITDHKKLEDALRENEEKYRNIISNMNLGIIEVDKNENIIYANQGFCLISGYSVEELLTMNTSAFLIHPEDNSILYNKLKLREKGISDSYELVVKNKKGEQRCWLVSGAPNYNDNHTMTGSIGIHLDITEQKMLENELEKALSKAEQATKAQEMFLANMSHEIRTPLNVITGMVRQLNKEDLTEKQREYVKNSETSTSHLLTIVNNILDMSKIQAGEFELYIKDFSVESVATDVISILHSRAKEKNLDLNLSISNDVKPALIGDPGRLRQILINLIGNSIKFTDSGQISLNIKVLSTNSYSQRVLFEVIDTGIGMSEEFMNRLFEKFTQEEASANRRFEGSGLGMSITKELVNLMGGSVNAKSQKGIGTQIGVEINFEIGNKEKLVVKTIKINKNSFKGVSILLVEDNEMNRFIAIQSLKISGCKITEAVNGKDAIKKLKENFFDIILMDIQMPQMNGVEATQFIRKELNIQTPIIALTANAFKNDIDLYLSIGMTDYLIKPYKEEDLYRVVDKYVKKRIPKEKLYDTEELLRLSAGDSTFVSKILKVFVKLANETIIQFNESLKINDLDAIHKAAHKIKPSIDNLKIQMLFEPIRQLEKYNPDNISESDFKNLIDEIIKVLENVVKEIKSS